MEKERKVPDVSMDHSGDLIDIPGDLRSRYCTEKGSWLINDKKLIKLANDILRSKNLERLSIDPNHIVTNWAIDFCAQALRNIVIGMGGKQDGVMMRSGFQISVSSELMAILSIAISMVMP